MADDASCLFDFPDTPFFAHMSSAYPNMLSLWKTPPPPAAVTAFMCDLQTAQKSVQSGTNQDAHQQRLHHQWTDF